MATSSTVWWPSTWRSPVGLDRRGRTRRGGRAGRACGRRTAARCWPRTSPVGRRGRCATAMLVSLVVRSLAGGPAHASDLFQGGEERVVLVGGADRDTEAAVEARPRRAVAHEHRAVEQGLPHRRRRRARCGRNSTKLAPDGHTSTGSSASAGDEAAPLLDERRHPGPHLVVEVEREPPGHLLHRVEVVRQHHLVELGHERATARRGSRGGRRPSTTSSSRCG